jgi:hypothetical protein
VGEAWLRSRQRIDKGTGQNAHPVRYSDLAAAFGSPGVGVEGGEGGLPAGIVRYVLFL